MDEACPPSYMLFFFSFFQHRNQKVSFHHFQNQCLKFCLTKGKVRAIDGTDAGSKGDHFGGLCFGGQFSQVDLRLRPTGLRGHYVGLGPVHVGFLCQIWFQTAFGNFQISNSPFKGRSVGKEHFQKNLQKVIPNVWHFKTFASDL